MGQTAIDIRSEIGPLKRVLLHRPGRELENLMPEYIERLLFDDIPYLKIARRSTTLSATCCGKTGWRWSTSPTWWRSLSPILR